jgi:hypothetical protein
MTVDLAALSFVVAAGPLHVQSFSGSFTVLDLDSGDLLLGADFTLGFGGGVLGGNNFILSAGTVIGAITYTSDFFDATQLVDPKGITFTLSNLIPSLALTGPVGSQVFVDFDSPDTANFNASVAVPEPATLLSAVPLMVVGGLWLRRRKAA